jgi:hypothetical protein
VRAPPPPADVARVGPRLVRAAYPSHSTRPRARPPTRASPLAAVARALLLRLTKPWPFPLSRPPGKVGLFILGKSVYAFRTPGLIWVGAGGAGAAGPAAGACARPRRQRGALPAGCPPGPPQAAPCFHYPLIPLSRALPSGKKTQLPKLKTNRLVKLRDVSMRSVVPALQASRAPSSRFLYPAAAEPPPPLRRAVLLSRAVRLPALAASPATHRQHPPPSPDDPFGLLRPASPCQGPIDIPDPNPRRLTLTFRVTKGTATGWDGKTENMLTQEAPYAVKVAAGKGVIGRALAGCLLPRARLHVFPPCVRPLPPSSSPPPPLRATHPCPARPAVWSRRQLVPDHHRHQALGEGSPPGQSQPPRGCAACDSKVRRRRRRRCARRRPAASPPTPKLRRRPSQSPTPPPTPRAPPQTVGAA